jgi:hypothetical protein
MIKTLVILLVIVIVASVIYGVVVGMKENYTDLSKDFKENNPKDYNIQSIACSDNAINEAISNYTFTSVPSIR